MEITSEKWKYQLAKFARPEKIEIYQRFFKTGKGEYAEGDKFIGVTVPDNRTVAKSFKDAPIEIFQQMLLSEIHEHRISALFAMVYSFTKTKSNDRRTEILTLYLSNIAQCNNWDLVDCSAPYIIGEELSKGNLTNQHHQLSQSPLLWARRISVVATLRLVMKYRQTTLALEMCKNHLLDPEALMHKAVGWVLREVGKKDMQALIDFIEDNISQMTAITLSYATEKMPIEQRHKYQNMRKSKKSLTLR